MLLCFMLLFSAGASGKNVVTIVFKNGKQLASSFIANTSSTVKGLAAHVTCDMWARWGMAVLCCCWVEKKCFSRLAST
jgi:hypothetical protein